MTGQTVTARLQLHPTRLSDVPALFRFLGDAEAMRFTHRDASLRDCRRRIAAHAWQGRRDGYAPWTVRRRDDSRIIGWGGLYQDPFMPGWGPEIGYFLAPEAWGFGYASELVSACLAVADGSLRLPALTAFAHPENTASQRVLTKAGFTFSRVVPELQRLLFLRQKPQQALAE